MEVVAGVEVVGGVVQESKGGAGGCEGCCSSRWSGPRIERLSGLGCPKNQYRLDFLVSYQKKEREQVFFFKLKPH